MDSIEGIKLGFSLKADKIICDTSIYDCNSFGGQRVGLRWSAIIELPISFIDEIKNLIESVLDRELIFEYEDYLEAQKTWWVENRKKEILNN